jgi:hypothetical protein
LILLYLLLIALPFLARREAGARICTLDTDNVNAIHILVNKAFGAIVVVCNTTTGGS